MAGSLPTRPSLCDGPPAPPSAGPPRPSSYAARLAWWASFVVVGLLAHGALLFDDGLQLDDWYLAEWLLQRRLGLFLHWATVFYNLAYPWFHFAFLAFPDLVFGHRLFTVAVLVVSAGLLAKIVRAANLAPPGVALAIGLLSLVAPANRALQVFLASGLPMGCVALFLTATILILRAERLNGSARRWRRGIAAVCFWLSFSLNSLLVPYVGLCLGLAFWRWQASGRRAVLSWLAQHWIFVLMPWVYWAIRMLWLYHVSDTAPGSGSAYNRIRWDLDGGALVYREALRTYAEIAWGWVRPGTVVLFGVAAAAVALARRALPCETVPRRAGASLAFVGGALFFLGLFPYAVVGKGIGPPGAHWAGHYGALLAAPLGLLVVGVTVAMFGGLTRVAWALTFTVLAAWTSESVTTHIHWHAEAVKWKSVCRQTNRSPEARQSNIVAVVDEWPLGMHNTVEGGAVGRLVMGGRLLRDVTFEFAPGFQPFFHAFCAPGTPKDALELPRPAPSRSHAALEAAADALDMAARAGRMAPAALHEALTVLARADPSAPEAVRAAIGRQWNEVREGLVLRDQDDPRRSLRLRAHLQLVGLPPGPAITAWSPSQRTLLTNLGLASAALPQPVLVVVRPGPDQKAVPVGSGKWWRQARRLWFDYQRARFLGEPDAVATLLDRVAIVEVLRLSE